MTDSDRPTSDPPEVKAFDRAIGKAFRHGIRWLYYTRRGTQLAIFLAAIVGWLIRHLQHLRGILP